MDPLDPSRRRDPAVDLHADADVHADLPTVRPARPASPPPELPDVDASVLTRAVQAAARTRAPDAVNVDARAPDVALRRHLDAFRAAATPTYHTPQGDVVVPIPFRTAKDPELLRDDGAAAGIYAGRERAVEANRAVLLKVAGSVGVSPRDAMLVQLGRGSPEHVQRLTQALIDQGHLPERVVSLADPPVVRTDLAPRVKDMMLRYGLGLDGPGYAQQALNLGSRGFSRVSLRDARPGDVLALTAGERAIVYDRRAATDSERAAVAVATGSDVPATHEVTAWVVDGAWRPRWSNEAVEFVGGGAGRLTLLHDETTGQWVSTDERGRLRASPAPLGEDLQGVYRATTPHPS